MSASLLCCQSNKKIVGVYCAKHGKGSDCIEFKKNGTFIQFYEFQSQKKSNEGTWEFITQRGHEKIMLRGFVHYVLPYEDKHGLIGRRGSASMYWTGDEIGGDVDKGVQLLQRENE